MAARPALLITRRLTDAVHARASRDYETVLNIEDRVFSKDELIARCQDVDAVLPCHSEIFSADVIAALPARLKVIANHSVGVDHVDLAASKARGLIVTNTPDVLSDATAEIAMLCMLGAARRGSEGDRMVREGRWDSWSPAFMVGRQVTGKRFGVAGMGRVGQVAAQRARGFGMEIHYHNRRRLPPELEQGAQFHPTLEGLLAVSDVLSLHCPATPETTGMMDAAAFARMPEGAILVNTARGALVDEAAMIAALNSGHIRHAGLDVFHNEPLKADHPLARMENVTLSAHAAFRTLEASMTLLRRAIDIVKRVQA
jgi:lactate dehydrogenase-like 2-hydroxyacid dehydrogenase